jgi:BirA family biotin operon repressor/biotin-[acetyl-CoA-carboxylase] ligase
VSVLVDVVRFESLGSTNDYCRGLVLNAGGGAAELRDIAVMADVQTAGRGRLNTRSWVSVAGNFHGSFIMNVAELGFEVAEISLITSLSVRSIASFLAAIVAKDSFTFKLPNDVLVGGKKICGVLTEAIYPFVIIGIGINLVNSPLAEATDLQTEFNIVVKPEDLVQDLYGALVDTLRNAYH